MVDADSAGHEICEVAPDLIHRVAASGVLTYVNPAWCRALAYTRQQAATLAWRDVVQEGHRNRFGRALEAARDGQPASRLESRFVTREGRGFPVEGSIALLRGDEGEIGAVFHDIAARRRERAQVDRLFSLSLDLLCIAGGDGYFKRVNPAFERTLGYTREELTSRSFLDFVHPDDREATLAALERLVGGEAVVDFRNRYRAKDGRFRWLQWRSSPVDEAGYVYAVARDVTEGLEAQEIIARQAAELARSNEDLEQFAYAASHDLQAPLRAIDSLVGFLASDLEAAPARVPEHLDRLHARVSQMRELIADLLTYSRAGRASGQVREVELGEMVAELASLLDVPAGFRVRTSGSATSLRTAAAPLELVLRNLVANAIGHHDRDTGEVVVSLDRAGTMWRFAVADDGPGIPSGERDRVFQMFHRLGGGESGGSGMGLALVKKIVDRLGGRVWIEEADGRGTTVRFTWPDRMPEAEAE